MSISPTDVQRSNSSPSQNLSQNPNHNHGGFLPASPHLLGSPNSSVTHNFHSLQISGSHSPSNSSNRTSGTMGSAAADSGGTSKKVSDGRSSYGRRSSYRQPHGSYSQRQSAGRGQGGISSQFRNDHIGSAQPTGELAGDASLQQQPNSGSVGLSAGRKNNTVNANHLLNFQYDRISRPARLQPRMPPPRRQQKIKPYNKDLFLQANYKFVVLDSGDYAVESADPDKMLQWENVIWVKYSTPYPVQCPICLDQPLCPQITSCGHIFCFPCILRYLLMGEEDHKGDCWKKCPLCFMMVSSKDLYTIYIENVRHYNVGDTMELTLLTRQKNSLFPSQKNQEGVDSITSGGVDLSDSFSKFILTSDVELSVREACSELKGWLARADSGLVDDLDQLPYVCAAVEQLEQRKKFWAEIQSLCGSPPLRNPYPTTLPSSVKGCKHPSKAESQTLSSSMNDVVDSEIYGGTCATPFVGHEDLSVLIGNSNAKEVHRDDQMSQNDLSETFEGDGKALSSSCDEGKIVERVSNATNQYKEKDSYSFYQAVDGQHLILHPLNMKCLLHYFGSYDLLPPRISGEILQLETVTQSEAMRRRYRYLSHFSLTTTFQLCEIDMTKILPSDAITPFKDEINKREYQRKRLAKKEHQEKVKAEAAEILAMPVPSNFGSSSFVDNAFSMDDFEALGNSSVPSTSPQVTGERKRFSDVTRLGFAAAHDSPSLMVGESADVSGNTGERSETSGQRGLVTLSFANIISTAKSPEGGEVPKVNGFAGKKGKKPSRVLLSTAGGRRY